MNVFIRQLTGIRFVAAAWVLLYHLQGPMNTLGLLSIPLFADVVRRPDGGRGLAGVVAKSGAYWNPVEDELKGIVAKKNAGRREVRS